MFNSANVAAQSRDQEVDHEAYPRLIKVSLWARTSHCTLHHLPDILTSMMAARGVQSDASERRK